MKIWKSTESGLIDDAEFQVNRKTVLVLPGIDADDSVPKFRDGYAKIAENFLGGKDILNAVDIFTVSWSNENERMDNIKESSKNPHQYYSNDIEKLVEKTLEPILKEKEFDKLDNLTILTHSFGGTAINMVEARLNMIMLKNGYSEKESNNVFERIKVVSISPPSKTKNLDELHFPTVFILPTNDLQTALSEYSDYFKKGNFHQTAVIENGKNLIVEGTVPTIKLNAEGEMIFDAKAHRMKHISMEHIGSIDSEKKDLIPQIIQNTLNNLVKRKSGDVNLKEMIKMTPQIADSTDEKSFSYMVMQQDINDLITSSELKSIVKL